MRGRGWGDAASGEDEAEQDALFAGPRDVVVVPPDERTAGQAALAGDEPLNEETLGELFEGAPPATEELVHEVSAVTEVLLDEGPLAAPPSEEDVELGWAEARFNEAPEG